MTSLEQTAATRLLAARPAVLARPTLAAAAVCLVSFTAFWWAQRAAQVSMIDLMVYRAEGWTVRTGGDLYAMRATEARLPTTYPPFAALLFVPLTVLGVPEMRALATLGNLLLLVALVHFSLRLAGRPLRYPRAAVTLAVAAVAVWCEPVWTTLRYGQVNLVLAVLVLWDLTGRPGRRWAGAGIGIAAGIKLTPALFAVFLVLAGAARGRRWLRTAVAAPGGPAPRGTGTVRGADGAAPAAGRPRGADGGDRVPGGCGAFGRHPLLRQAAVATATFLGTALLAWAALPRDSYRFWSGTLFAAGRAGWAEETANQSLRGVLARLLHTGDPGLWWGAAAVVVAAAGLAVSVALALTADSPAWSVLACAVTALLVSPVSWSHHWVWCVPLVLLLGSEALRRGGPAWWAGTAAAALLFCSYALWWVPHESWMRAELRQSGGEMLLSAVYPGAGAVFLAVAAGVVVRARRRQAVANE